MEEYKPLKQLDFKQKMQLQGLYKRKKKGEFISPEELELANAYREEWQQEERKAKSMRPIIILVLIGALLRLMYH
jgi:hypothetical protein